MTTCENLTLPGFELTASTGSQPSAEASHAKTSRWLEKVLVLTESEAAYGESSAVSLASFDLSTSSWRTLELCGLEDSPKFSQTLPRSGMTRSGTLFLLPPLVRLIYASGYGSSALLPTPTMDMVSNRTKPYAQGGTPLTLALLSTPTATMSDRGGRGDLVQQLRGNNSPSGHYRALLPTPQAQDFRNAADYSDGSRGHSPQLRHLGSGLLNPRFVEWMMGLPSGWTALP
jgi:hypothetical protein